MFLKNFHFKLPILTTQGREQIIVFRSAQCVIMDFICFVQKVLLIKQPWSLNFRGFFQTIDLVKKEIDFSSVERRA